jgi:hypothetical protein
VTQEMIEKALNVLHVVRDEFEQDLSVRAGIEL